MRSITSEYFKSLSLTVFENIYGQDLFLKNEKRPYLPTGSESFDENKKRSTSFIFTSTLKFSSKSIQSSLRNRPDQIWENEKFFDDNRKLTNLFPVDLIFSNTIKETLSIGLGLILKEIF